MASTWFRSIAAIEDADLGTGRRGGEQRGDEGRGEDGHRDGSGSAYQASSPWPRRHLPTPSGRAASRPIERGRRARPSAKAPRRARRILRRGLRGPHCDDARSDSRRGGSRGPPGVRVDRCDSPLGPGSDRTRWWRLLGSGGMSEVYRARDSRLQREVAIKVVGESLAGDAGFLSRLEQEARLAGGAQPPQHRRGPRHRGPRGNALRRHRAAPGRDAPGAAVAWAGLDRPGARLGRADRPRALRGPRPRHRPSGPQAGERLPHPARPGEAPRLRNRQVHARG